MPSSFIFNGVLIKERDFSISLSNRSFKYGDGCFETMKYLRGHLVNSALHFERFFYSLKTLKMSLPHNVEPQMLEQQVKELVKENDVEEHSRVRLMAYRSHEEHKAEYIIEAVAGTETSNHYNNKGLTLDIFPDARKSCDTFSSLKSNNYLIYAMASIWAKEKGLDDAIVCNTSDRVADSSIANIFIINNGLIKTPPLTEGCVDGVMRKYLISKLKLDNLPSLETPLSLDDINNAQEVFITNAITGLRWVKNIGKAHFTNDLSSHLYKKIISPIFQ